MIDSIKFRDVVKANDLLEKEHSAKVMHLNVTKTEGHAVCVFAVDKEWFIYDVMEGTYSIGEFESPPTPKQVLMHIQAQSNPDVVVSKPRWAIK